MKHRARLRSGCIHHSPLVVSREMMSAGGDCDDRRGVGGRWSWFYFFIVRSFASRLAGIMGIWESIGVIFSWVGSLKRVINVIVWWMSDVIGEGEVGVHNCGGQRHYTWVRWVIM